jgi:hypothetical protein
VKLTNQQRDLLRRLATGSKYYGGVTGAALVRKGLASRNKYDCLTITDLGRAALRKGGET